MNPFHGRHFQGEIILLYESNKVSYYVVCKCFILLILNLNDIY